MQNAHNNNTNESAHDLEHRQWLTSHALVRQQKIRTRIMLSLLLLSLFLMVLLLPAKNLLDIYEIKLAMGPNDDDRMQGYNQEVEALQHKISGLITASIESKLQVIENRIQSGKISLDDIKTIEELKNDLSVLEAYTVRPALIKRTEKPASAARPRKAVHPQDGLLEEVAQLKSLFYFAVACFGVIVTVIGGYWLQGSLGYKRIASGFAKSPALLGSKEPPSD